MVSAHLPDWKVKQVKVVSTLEMETGSWEMTGCRGRMVPLPILTASQFIAG